MQLHYYRGTNAFRIEVSLDDSIWTKVVEGSLQDPKDKGCNVPLEQFSTSKIVHARWIKFVAETHYSPGAGLNYITWTFYQ